MYNQMIVLLHPPTGGTAESALTELLSSIHPYQNDSSPRNRLDHYQVIPPDVMGQLQGLILFNTRNHLSRFDVRSSSLTEFPQMSELWTSVCTGSHWLIKKNKGKVSDLELSNAFNKNPFDYFRFQLDIQLCYIPCVSSKTPGGTVLEISKY